MKFEIYKRKAKNIWLKAVILMIFIVIALFVFINQFSINMAICGFSNHGKNTLRMFVLDVGQANANFLVLNDGTSILIDAGSENSEQTLVKQIDWILRDGKLDAIDFLILTHPDEDHVGGADAILKSFQVNNVLRPKIASKSENNLEGFDVVYTSAYDNAIRAVMVEPHCTVDYVQDSMFKIGSTTIQIFASEKTQGVETNALSPFVFVEYAGKSFLFTGDATAKREEELLSRLESDGIRWKIDFLVVAHHGSKFSSTQKFLESISPQYAFISAGDDSHPAKEVLSRLKGCNVKATYITKKVGTIAVFVNNNGAFRILTTQNSFDLPTLIVLLMCLAFVIVKLVDVKKESFVQKMHKFEKNL